MFKIWNSNPGSYTLSQREKDEVMEKPEVTSQHEIPVWMLFREIDTYIRSRLEVEAPRAPEDRYESNEIDKLAEALAKAKLKLGPIFCNQENPFFKSKYADIGALTEVIEKPLAECGLSIVQPTHFMSDGATIVRTKLLHSSGQWMESRARLIPSKNDHQGYGSALTYIRRYQMSSLLGLGIDKDDDAEGAMEEFRDQQMSGTAKTFARSRPGPVINPTQLKDLQQLLEGHPDTEKDMLDKMKILSLADYPADKFDVGKQRIKEIIQSKEQSKEARR